MLEHVSQFIESVSSLKVLVVGETIIDEFIEVSYEGQSMKSLCPVFKLEGQPLRQQGGASAIANHLKDFVKKVEIITNQHEEIVKTRYIDVNDHKKHVEINRFNKNGFRSIKVNCKDYDVVIVADFGHGFCDQLEISGEFHLMCQTNSNNFGFNRISKWKKHQKKSACIDLREASLQINKRISQLNETIIREIYNYELCARDVFITVGKAGAWYADENNLKFRKSFPCEVVDTIGAGDAFFAFASLASHLKEQLDDLLLVPSLAASLSTTWLCNEKSVNKEQLLKHAAQYV
jgi:Sugar kinases, ribokinase family